jgi:hypothetical protein
MLHHNNNISFHSAQIHSRSRSMNPAGRSALVIMFFCKCSHVESSHPQNDVL